MLLLISPHYLMAQVKPAQELGELFERVQMARIFEDSKTFADCIPTAPVATIMAAYEKQKDRRNFSLEKFVSRYFALPPTPASGFVSDRTMDVVQHINRLWPVLTRDPDTEVGSLLPLPYRYIVPGGRFREIYYWDTYFTMLGLQEDGRDDLITNMVDNFSYLIQTHGFIPNGNRSYYLSRSQPPFYAMTVALLADIKGNAILADYLPHLEKEYAFWMDGAGDLAAGEVHRRAVRMPDGSLLNRYWDDSPTPRPESFYEDVELSHASSRPAKALYRDIRAACESGWDFSSRWLRDPMQLGTIHTTEIIPVDLNCLMYNLERTLAKAYGEVGNFDRELEMRLTARKRKEAIRRYCWDEALGFYFDYDFVAQELKEVWSMAGAFPLFFKILTPDEAEVAAANLTEKLLREGGFLSTMIESGQQWDSPNGWAPLQWVGVAGLRNYGMLEMATDAANRWIALNKRVYENTGKLVEKYDVTGTSDEAGGGEYPLQDGFGWTNGVLLKMIREFGEK